MGLPPTGAFVAAFSSVAVAVLGLWKFKTLQQEVKLLVALLVILVVIEGLSLYLILSYEGNNLWLSHLVTLLQYVVLAWILAQWQSQEGKRRGILISIWVFIGLWLAAKLTVEGFNQYDNYTATLSGAMLVVIAAQTLQQLNYGNLKNFFRNSRFWISLGVLVYFSGTLIFLALINEIVRLSSSAILLAWSIQWLITVVSNILYAEGIICQRRQ